MSLRFIALFFIPFCGIMIIVLLTTDCSQDRKMSLRLYEKRLPNYLSVIFKSQINITTFQIVRILLSFFLGVLYSNNNMLLTILISTALYFLFYQIVTKVYMGKLSEINLIFPYYMKSLAMLCYRNPVSNALVKSLKVCDGALRIKLENLINELDNTPASFQPYQDFIDSFEGRLNNGEFYFRMLFQISNTSSIHAVKLIDSLNKSVSLQINQVRYKKNKAINDYVGYIGLLPVGLLVVVLTYILVLTISLV